MELWVHVSRLLMLHLDRNIWKHLCVYGLFRAHNNTLQFSHFIVIPIDTSQLFITEHPAGEAGYSVMSLELLTVSCPRSRKGEEKRKKNQFWFQKYKEYGCSSKLWVHVSRLLVLHLDRNQWKHFCVYGLFGACDNT